MDAAHALVVDAHVVIGAPGLAREPITTAHLRASDGSVHVVRVVGGPIAGGGAAHIAGRVVPAAGAIVRLDLGEEPAPRVPSGAVTTWWTRNTPAATWAASSLPVAFTLAVDATGASSRDLGAADALSELDVALRAWPRVSCTSWRAALSPPAQLVAGDDGVNGVFWHDDVWPPELIPSALGQTIVHTDANGNLHDTDIHVNGADYFWSLDGHGSTIDARSIYEHELGHALGLGHSADVGATMNATYPGGIGWRSLEQDDRDAVCALYPGRGAAGCEAGPACPAGFVCTAHVCERGGVRGEVCSPCARVLGACAGAGDDARCLDLGDGGATGMVCGRACATDDDCGPRFTCAPTTSSGDVQCVPLDGCAGGPDPCATDFDCEADAGELCRGGACVGAPSGMVTIDAGAVVDAAADAGTKGGSPRADGGCATAPLNPSRFAAGRTAGYIAAFVAAITFAARRRRGRERSRSEDGASSRLR